MPKRSSSRMVDSELDAGPMVQMILARRPAAGSVPSIVKSTMIDASALLRSPETRSSLVLVKSVPRRAGGLPVCSIGTNVCRACRVKLDFRRDSKREASLLRRLRARQFNGRRFSQDGTREEHGVELGADQDHQRDHVHPHQQRDADA